MSADKVMQTLVKADKKYPTGKIPTQVLKTNTLKMSFLKTHDFIKDTSQKALVQFGPRYAQQMGCCCLVTPGLAQSILHRLLL
jgi:hypothetical protein